MLEIFLVYAAILISTGQKITLFEHRQEHSLTKCKHGLVNAVDTVVFKSQVDYSQDTALKYAHFYIQKKGDQVPLLYDDLNIQECVSGQRITCERVGMFLINVSIKVPASNDYSSATISAELVTSDWKATLSEKHDFPKIMDGTSSNGLLILNGNTISTNLTGCDLNVNDPILNITYICESDIKPCLIEITASGVEKSSRGEDHANYILEQRPQDLNLTIKYASCTLDGEYNTFQCRIHKDATSCNFDNPVIIIASIAAVLIVVAVVFCIIGFYRRKKVKSAFLKQTTMDTTDMNEERGMPLLTKITARVNYPQINTSKNLKDYPCAKNPGHHKFHAFNEFKLDNLHKDYQDIEILTLIKCIANLTTRVCVEYTSEYRSNPVNDGNGMNLNYQVKDKTAHRYKTGMIINVQDYSDDYSKCPCEMCKGKCEQSTSWGNVFVLTASTVVYDDSEAEKSSFDLFYNSDTSEISTLHGRRVSEIDISEGWCVVECFTCDLSLLDRLIAMTNKCQDQMIKVNRKYNTPEHLRTFTCIVAHPHGCSKHVTIGHCKDKETESNDQHYLHTRYQYTTRTCPGSAGAFVYILGVSDISQKSYHVHLSYESDRCNYCSIGMEKVPENMYS